VSLPRHQLSPTLVTLPPFPAAGTSHVPDNFGASCTELDPLRAKLQATWRQNLQKVHEIGASQ